MNWLVGCGYCGLALCFCGLWVWVFGVCAAIGGGFGGFVCWWGCRWLGVGGSNWFGLFGFGFASCLVFGLGLFWGLRCLGVGVV